MSHETRWTAEKIAARLRLITPLVYRRTAPLPPFRYRRLHGPDAPAPVGPEVDDEEWELLPPGTFWGERESDFALRGEFRLPDGWDPEVPTALRFAIGEAPDFIHPEALVYVDGAPYAAVDRFHHEVLLDRGWLDGEEHLLVLRGFTGIWKVDQNGQPYAMQLHMGQSQLVQIDEATRAFVAKARVALEAVQHLGKDNPARWELLNALDVAFRRLDTREPLGARFYHSVPGAHEALCRGIERAGPPHAATIVAAGHAHIDLAWLWTLGQTRRKAGRTFHNVLRLMEQFPDYRFTQSQPQLYEYVLQDYPALFDAIRERAAEGRWEPIGGMWVEADCNISGPESLARQFLLGQRFLRDHFGDAVSAVLWLPDVFGYAWNLPQLIKQAGLDYFFTIKIGWSQYNRLPYDSFWWQGLDGTRVLTHFSTTPDPGDFPSNGTYNAVLGPRAALGTWENFQQKELQDTFLMSYGYGDGGGGPTREMLENMSELTAFPGIPRVQPGRVDDFFRQLDAESGERLPVWNGELYLEMHRGTYTSQSRNKRANRKSEFLLHDAEFSAALAALLDPEYVYPHDRLRRAWELVCLNQFHDIIPGSSIREVYEESLAQYEEVAAAGEEVRDGALEVIAERMGAQRLLVNPSGFPRRDLVFWPSRHDAPPLQRGDGAVIATQPVEGGLLLDAGQLPPYSVTPLLEAAGLEVRGLEAPEKEKAPPASVPSSPTGGARALTVKASPTLLENALLRVELDDAGHITRIYDRRAQREVLPPSALANELQIFEDRPLNWDAWDIDIFYDDRYWTAEVESVRVVEEGPLRAALELRGTILHSPFVQRISLSHNSACLRFDTTVDWRERHILLKAAFPIDVLSPTATYEIQWGNVERPTHRNTSWDWARFETAAQKWVDLSEGGYGVSLLNDCKYGHDIHDNVLRITLLRSPTHPDPEADQGEHRFSYALLPHGGRVDEETIGAAYALNDPAFVFAAKDGEGTTTADLPLSLLAVDQPNVVVETVKQAEDGNGIIVRLYEALRHRGPVTLRCAFPLESAFLTNLLEEPERPLPVEGNSVQLTLRPYQIATLRLVRGEEVEASREGGAEQTLPAPPA